MAFSMLGAMVPLSILLFAVAMIAIPMVWPL